MDSFRRWLQLLRIPLAFLGVALFFTLYNRFIIDANLKNLKTSLSVLEPATGVGQAEAALILVDQTLVTAMAKEELDLRTVSTLQYVQGTLSNPQAERTVVDAQVMVNTVFQEQKSARTGVLGVLDQLGSGFQQTVTRAALLPRQIGAKKGSEEIDASRLAQANRWERLGLFAEAASAYEGLIRTYPNYKGRGSLKLRLGYVYQHNQSFDQSERLYQEVLQETRNPQETAVAKALLSQLDRARGLRRDADRLERKLAALGSGAERQRLQIQLGSLWLQLGMMDKAAESFRLAALADPEGGLVLPSLFKEAWCLKYLGRFKEALQTFQEIIRGDPESSWASAARNQMAEIYKATDDYPRAMQLYEENLTLSNDPSSKDLTLTFAGCTALYDLKDPDKATAYFKQLESKFPASPFSTVEEDMARLEAAKAMLAVGSAQSFTLGTPLFSWSERILPIFVQTFADRLAKYMEVAGEKELSRKYTEEEFRKIVLRRVQERFPGQIQVNEMAIGPNGYTGSGSARVGFLTFALSGRIGIQVEKERPHVVIHEMRVWKIPVPELVRNRLAQRVNQMIDGLKLPLKVTQYDFKEGYVVIHVKRVERVE